MCVGRWTPLPCCETPFLSLMRCLNRMSLCHCHLGTFWRPLGHSRAKAQCVRLGASTWDCLCCFEIQLLEKKKKEIQLLEDDRVGTRNSVNRSFPMVLQKYFFEKNELGGCVPRFSFATTKGSELKGGWCKTPRWRGQQGKGQSCSRCESQEVWEGKCHGNRCGQGQPPFHHLPVRPFNCDLLRR